MPHPDFQPTLLGPTITIRPISSDDWPELFAAGSDPEIWKVHPVPDRYTEPEFRKFFDGAVNSKMAFCVRRSGERPADRLQPLLRLCARTQRDRDRLDFYRPQLVGRSRQPRGQAPDARPRLHLRRHRRVLGRRGKLALAGRHDQDRRRQARGAFHPRIVRRRRRISSSKSAGPLSAGRPGAGWREDSPCLAVI